MTNKLECKLIEVALKPVKMMLYLVVLGIMFWFPAPKVHIVANEGTIGWHTVPCGKFCPLCVQKGG